jgi:serine/threonine protein kinase, bacterial
MNTVNLGAILSDRYRILKKLGEGGFGNTYLAEDINRFNELCVLKEFAPKLQEENAIAKAKDLFQREAGVLYQLKHPQIPKFRELFQVKLQDKEHLFLVQDYVEGQNYRHLLRNRQSQGLGFSESEMTQLLLQLLPVLHYIHSLGVIHRDISPENIMLRNSDMLPVLIDFGGVKHIEAEVEYQVLGSSQNTDLLTRLGKIGYAPDEQLNRGLVFPHSDLFALAVTILVLLTGREPQQLMNHDTLEWEWEKYIRLSPQFTSVLQKMLAKQPGNRFTSAQEILSVLQNFSTIPPIQSNLTQPITQAPHTAVTMVAAPTNNSNFASTDLLASPDEPTKKGADWLVNMVVILLLAGIAGLMGWYAGNHLMEKAKENPPVDNPVATSTPTPTPDKETEEDLGELSAEELKRRQELSVLRRELGIEYDFYVALVNQEFWRQYPEKIGQIPSQNPEDAPWREKWDAIALKTLKKLEFLTPSARKQLGSYTQSQQNQWKQEANGLHLSSSALSDLADATFLYRFGDQQKIEDINQPMGQVWNGIIFDTLQGLKSGELYEEIIFSANSIGVKKNVTLFAGKGKAYVAELKADQFMAIKLTSSRDILLSIYTPSGKNPILVDSSEKKWSGILPESGYYEFIIVSNSADTGDLNLELTVENIAIETPPTDPEDIIIDPVVTPDPIPSETPETTPTPTPEVEETQTPENNNPIEGN